MTTTCTTSPSAIEAEEAVIALCMLDQDAAKDAVDLIGWGDFFGHETGMIFRAIEYLVRKGSPIDATSLVTLLEAKGFLKDAGGAAKVAGMLDIPCCGDVSHYCGIIKDRAIKRKLIQVAARIAQRANNGDSAKDALNYAQAEVMGIDAGGGDETIALKDCVDAVMDGIDALVDTIPTVTGIPSRLTGLDVLTSGWQPSDLIILAARPSMGKTALSLKLTREAAHHGSRVLFFSLEQSRSQLTRRMMSTTARVNLQKFKSGGITFDEMKRITAAAGTLYDHQVVVCDRSIVSHQDVARISRRESRRGLDMIVIDYLQLMAGDGRESRQYEITAISRALKCVAKDLGVPVICLSQLNRGLESRENKRPKLADLRESGAIEQDADLVLFIYRDEVYNPETPETGIAELILSKQRDGPTGMTKVKWHPEYASFENLEV